MPASRAHREAALVRMMLAELDITKPLENISLFPSFFNSSFNRIRYWLLKKHGDGSRRCGQWGYYGAGIFGGQSHFRSSSQSHCPECVRYYRSGTDARQPQGRQERKILAQQSV